MRYPASEKLEIIRLVEQSHLPARRALQQIGIPRSTFYRWCDLYRTGGPEALVGANLACAVAFARSTLPEAMALHAVTQMASNGWRGLLWLHYVRWRAAMSFLVGCAIAFGLWTFWRYVAFLLLGISPFVVRLVPSNLKPRSRTTPSRCAIQLGMHDANDAGRSVRAAGRQLFSRGQP
jgi:hypothetical protein